jgi:hypothetical protein
VLVERLDIGDHSGQLKIKLLLQLTLHIQLHTTIPIQMVLEFQFQIVAESTSNSQEFIQSLLAFNCQMLERKSTMLIFGSKRTG